MSADVSVVISTYNRVRSLAETLDALRHQQLPVSLTYEVIVVDNNSTDGTEAFVRSQQHSGFSQLRYVFEPQQGLSYGRNAGIAASTAPLVAFTDDDVEPDSGWIAAIKKEAARHPESAGLGGPVLPVWPGSVPTWLDRRHWAPLAIQDYGRGEFHTSAAFPRCLVAANLVLRREVIDRIGPFSPGFPRCQDHELQLRLWRAGEQIVYAPDMVVRSRVAPERLTKRYHRRWHGAHGWWTAEMRLHEIIDRNGTLLPAPLPARSFFGVPGFVFRDLGRSLAGWLRAAVAFDFATAFQQANRGRDLGAYIRRRMISWWGQRAAAKRAMPQDRCLPQSGPRPVR
jgi:GT2 family glycosyltransferase